MKSLGFIGAGRITRIMIEGWTRAGRSPSAVAVSDIAPEALAWTGDHPSVDTVDVASAAERDVVIVALHPPAMVELLPKIAPRLRPDAIVLSLAPKLKFARLTELLGGFARLARQNPNAPSIVNLGHNPIALGPGLDADARAELLDLLAPLGRTPIVDELVIETYAVISAMGPTYLWPQFALLRDLAVEFGLSPDAAREAVSDMVRGAAATLFDFDLPEARTLDLVPVKPMAADEETIRALYRSRLEPFHAKLTS